jgi:hypothetical protein
MVLLFQMTPKCSAEVLSLVPKGKKAGVCLSEKYMHSVNLFRPESILMNQLGIK